MNNVCMALWVGHVCAIHDGMRGFGRKQVHCPALPMVLGARQHVFPARPRSRCRGAGPRTIP